MTIVARVDPLNPDEGVIERAAEVIRRGGLVAFPTETVYGLGANAYNKSSVLRIFEVKQRPADNPLIIHVDSLDMLHEVARDIPEEAYKLMSKFWPGPLTLVLPKTDRVPYEATGGLDTVAVRMPAHPVALRLISRAGVPIAAPSANLSGRPSPTRGEHVVEDLYSKVEMIIDGGETLYGVESTIVNLLVKPPVLLRPGAYPVEEIERVLGVRVHVPGFARGLSEAERALAPGMRYRHYAPETPLLLVETDRYDADGLARLTLKVAELASEFKEGKVCVLASKETLARYSGLGAEVLSLGSRSNLYEVAHNLFSALRKIDELGCRVAIAEGFPEQGLGLTIMNRLRKASSRRFFT
ncbi:L-threonylcarbamoyladenylate synthase [Thermogladius sp.]|uniref:L-threonylcarbamoyladenylate synthase n=1 Tax=Thermogladius sp. TaxID=2023064 RepID=UPI003D0D21CA